ncbi:MAG: hypothetical protein Q7S23_03585 [bacterium]|nr:hypothetical protein [bacterium]
MENRAHGESRDERLRRFQDNPPTEAIGTLLNSVANFFNNEIAITPNNSQTSLLFLGIHAAALTISEVFFDKSGVEGYKLFLEKFVDGDSDDTKFSIIADLIHDWRNVLAHQWLGSVGHKIGYDYVMRLGWEVRDGITYINPKIYCEHYLKPFSSNGKMWDFLSMFSASELEDIKSRIIKKYLER